MAWEPDKWHQGGILSAACLPEDFRKDEISYYLIISHDCDLARTPDVEPFVEVLPCRPCSPDGNLCNARQARKLHLDFALSGYPNNFFELRAYDKTFVPKEKFRTVPDDLHIGKDALHILQSWLAARYRRQAIPDRLDHALKRFWKKFNGLAEPFSHVLHGIWITFEPSERGEVSEDGYTCDLFFVYDAEKGAQERIDELIERLRPVAESLMKDTPPIVLELKAVSDHVFTYHMLRRSMRWMHDYISLSADSPLDDT